MIDRLLESHDQLNLPWPRQSGIAPAAVSPDGRQFPHWRRLQKTCSSQHTNADWPPAQGEDNFKKERFVLSVAYSPDGKRLACGSMDGTVAVFDVASGKLLHTLDGHFKPVRSLTFTPGGDPCAVVQTPATCRGQTLWGTVCQGRSGCVTGAAPLQTAHLRAGRQHSTEEHCALIAAWELATCYLLTCMWPNG